MMMCGLHNMQVSWAGLITHPVATWPMVMCACAHSEEKKYLGLRCVNSGQKHWPRTGHSTMHILWHHDSIRAASMLYTASSQLS